MISQFYKLIQLKKAKNYWFYVTSIQIKLYYFIIQSELMYRKRLIQSFQSSMDEPLKKYNNFNILQKRFQVFAKIALIRLLWLGCKLQPIVLASNAVKSDLKIIISNRQSRSVEYTLYQHSPGIDPVRHNLRGMDSSV